jgi:hypothetical protein
VQIKKSVISFRASATSREERDLTSSQRWKFRLCPAQWHRVILYDFDVSEISVASIFKLPWRRRHQVPLGMSVTTHENIMWRNTDNHRLKRKCKGKCKLLVRRRGGGVHLCKVLLLEFGIKMAEVTSSTEKSTNRCGRKYKSKATGAQ